MERAGEKNECGRPITLMNFEVLYEDYERCINPKVVIKIDGVEVKQDIESLQLSLSMMYKANSLTILYHFDDEAMVLKTRKKVKLGSSIQLSLGYNDNVEDVFLGYLHTVEVVQHTEDFELELYAQDVKGLMMNHHRLIHYKEKSAQQILEDILKDDIYKPFINKWTIEKEKDMIDTYTQWTESDFTTMITICEEKNCFFYMRNDECIVEEIGSFFTPEITFTNFGLHYIKSVFCAEDINGSVHLQGFDHNLKPIEAKQAVALMKNDSKQTIFKGLTFVKRYDYCVDQNSLKTKAMQLAKKTASEVSSIAFSCIYVPQLQCGRKVNFDAISCIKASGVIIELEIVFQEHHFSCEGKAMVI